MNTSTHNLCTQLYTQPYYVLFLEEAKGARQELPLQAGVPSFVLFLECVRCPGVPRRLPQLRHDEAPALDAVRSLGAIRGGL